MAGEQKRYVGRPHPLAVAEIYRHVLGVEVLEEDQLQLADAELLRGFEMLEGDNPLVVGAEDCDSAALVGRKAHNLWRLKRAGIPVPPWIVVTTVAFERIVTERPDIKAKRDQFRERIISKFNLVGTADELSRMVAAVEAPAEIVGAIENLMRTSSIDYPVALRSSAQLEDLGTSPFAGAYTSMLDVGSNELVDALRACWASLYGPRAILQLADASENLHTSGTDIGGQAMAVIVQRMLGHGEYGVAFTADPVTRNTALIIIEGAAESAALVSGRSGGWRAVVDRDSRRIVEYSAEEGTEAVADAEKRNAIGRLLPLLLQAETVFGEPLDIEWAVVDAAPHLLQARPIVTSKIQPQPPLHAIRIVAPEEDPKGVAISYGDCEGLRAAYERKKFPLRRAAQRHGISLPSWFWLEWDEASLKASPAAAVQDLFASPDVWVDLSSNLRGILVKRGELRDYLARLVGHHPAGRMVALLRESWETDIGAVSGLLADDTVVVEYARGTLKGVLNGVAEPSKIWLSPDGTVFREDLAEQTVACIIDAETGALVNRSLPPGFRLPFPPEAAREINRATRRLAQEFEESRPEWWVIGTKPLLFDVSMDSQPLDPDAQVVLSPGQVEGTAVVVDDLRPFDALGDGWAVSVDGRDDRILKIPEIAEILERLESCRRTGRVVLVAPKPHVGLIALMEQFDGSIFNHGALLSHFAVVMRQKGVPSVVVPNAVQLIRDGMAIAIREGGIVEIAKG